MADGFPLPLGLLLPKCCVLVKKDFFFVKGKNQVGQKIHALDKKRMVKITVARFINAK